MHMEQRQHVQQSVPRPKRQGRAHVIGRQADGGVGQWNHLRARRGARGRQDEGIAGARRQRAIDAAPGFRADKAERTGPLAGPRHQIDDGYADGMGEASTCRIQVRTRQQRRYPQIAEIAPPFVGGEARVERHADRTGCDGDHRHRSLRAVRQYHRDPVGGADTEAAQPANRIVHAGPERAIGQRRPPGRQDGIAAGRRSPIARKKISEARKGRAAGVLVRRSVSQWLDNLRQARPFWLMLRYHSRAL